MRVGEFWSRFGGEKETEEVEGRGEEGGERLGRGEEKRGEEEEEGEEEVREGVGLVGGEEGEGRGKSVEE